MFGYVAATTAALLWFPYLVRPKAVENLYIMYRGQDLITNAAPSDVFAQGAFAAAVSLLIMYSLYKMTPYFFLTLGFALVVIEWVEETMVVLQRKQLNPNEALVESRAIRILTGAFDHGPCELVLPGLNFASSSLLIRASSILILFVDRLSPMLIMICTALVVTILVAQFIQFQFFQSFMSGYARLLRSLNEVLGCGHVQRRRVEVGLRIRIGACFGVTKESGLTVYDALVDKIISVLVNYRSG